MDDIDFLAALGMETVQSDPNALPAGPYDGIIQASDFVLIKKDNRLAHVVTYQVTEGSHKGAQRQEWFYLGNNAVDANGQPATDIKDVRGYTPTITENQKVWYKKRFVEDLKVPEYNKENITRGVVGMAVSFGVKHKDGYINIAWVNKRDPLASAVSLGDSPVDAPQVQAPVADPWATM